MLQDRVKKAGISEDSRCELGATTAAGHILCHHQRLADLERLSNMSKSKGLEFDRTQPAFLRRLRGEINGQVDDPDRHVNPVARPKRPKRLDADEDEGPTYVLEDTNATLTKEEYEALVKEGAKESNNNEPANESGKHEAINGERPKSTQKVAAIGAAKKRKTAKVIGAEEDEKDVKDTPLGKVYSESSEQPKHTEKKPPKKKKAKVNINFGDDEET
jgi:hypothetical protein